MESTCETTKKTENVGVKRKRSNNRRSVSIRKDTYERLSKYCEENDESRSSIVERLLQKFLESPQLLPKKEEDTQAQEPPKEQVQEVVESPKEPEEPEEPEKPSKEVEATKDPPKEVNLEDRKKLVRQVVEKYGRQQSSHFTF